MRFADVFNKKLKMKIESQQIEIADLKSKIDAVSTENIEHIKKIDELQIEIENFQKEFTDEHQNFLDMGVHLAKRRAECDALDEKLNQKENALQEAEEKLKVLQEEVIEMSEIKLLQDYNLYEPMYAFSNSQEYGEALKAVRAKQKTMIKNKTAAVCSAKWAVGGSFAEGKKLADNNIKLLLKTFNVECENAIGNVKFNNFESMEKRIHKLFEKLNDLGSINAVSISAEYFDLKIEELRLSYEYQKKLQEEKEEIKIQRAIARENAKVLRELEEKREKIEKEQAHYTTQLKLLTEQYEQEDNLARKEFIQEKIYAVENELEDLETALKDVDYREANERAGYVYIISNIGAFGENVYKIGMTRRLDPLERVNELGGASVPFKFDVHAMIFSNDAPQLEAALHNAFADKKINKINGRKEFFRVSLDEIEAVVQKHHDRTVDFVKEAQAEQYRESIRL